MLGVGRLGAGEELFDQLLKANFIVSLPFLSGSEVLAFIRT